METTREQRMQVADTIIAQFGGARRLSTMCGCKDFMAIESGVQFGIGSNAKGVNKVVVKLTAADLYDVEFGAVRRVKGVLTFKVLDRTEGAYAEMLPELFERATGMYLTF